MASDGVAWPALQLLLHTHVHADAGKEFEGLATRCGLRVAKHDTNLKQQATMLFLHAEIIAS